MLNYNPDLLRPVWEKVVVMRKRQLKSTGNALLTSLACFSETADRYVATAKAILRCD